MSDKYQRKVRVTMTAGQWLKVKCALWDAMEANNEYPTLRADIRHILIDVLSPQTDKAIEAADAECQRELAK